MSIIVDSKQVNLSSSSATVKNSTQNSVLLFKLNGILKKEKNILYNQISVVHAQIPISYYVVNNTNNFLSMSVGSYTLTNGNYNASTFATMLLSILGVNWSIKVNSITGIYTLSNTTTSFSIFGASTCYKLLGCAKSVIYNSVTSSGINYITFPFPCNFLGVNRIKIKSMILSTDNLDTISNGHSDLLTTVPVTNAYGGLIVYQNVSGLKNIFDNMDLNHIDISITDENDNVLDFNNIDIYITLQIDTIREQVQESTNLLHLINN